MEARLNTVYEFSPYLKENTPLCQYIDQVGKFAYRSNSCLQWKIIPSP
jgi:hypothetical protein